MRLTYVKIWQYICSHRSNLRLWSQIETAGFLPLLCRRPPAFPFLRVPLFSRVELLSYTCVCVIIVPDLPRYKLRMPLLRSPVPELISVPTLSQTAYHHEAGRNPNNRKTKNLKLLHDREYENGDILNNNSLIVEYIFLSSFFITKKLEKLIDKWTQHRDTMIPVGLFLHSKYILK